MTDAGHPPRAPFLWALTALTVAGCALWAVIAVLACYIIVRAPDWMGWMMQ